MSLPVATNNLTNQVFMMNVPVPILPRMNAAETLGVEAAFQEVQRVFEPFYGGVPHPLSGHAFLRCAIFWALREIDTLQQQGQTLQNILTCENLLRQVARASSSGCQVPNEPAVNFENRSFPQQILFINLAMVLVRYLIRMTPNVPIVLNNPAGAQHNQP